MKRPIETAQSKPNSKKKAKFSSQVVEDSNPVRAPQPASQSTKPVQSALKGSRLEPLPVPRRVTIKQTPQEDRPLKRSFSHIQPKPPLSESTVLNVVFGTYEHLLYGIQISFPASPAPPKITTLFHFVAHPTPITVLSVAPFGHTPTLVSSTADSPLTLWSLSKRKCLGTLSCGVLATDVGGAAREPGVRTARFDSLGKVLVVGDETGAMTIYRTRDWALVRKLSGSGKGRVNDLAIEPRQGRLMLSVGQDLCVRLWDLSGGGGKPKSKPMASMRLGAEADRVCWSPSSKKLLVITNTIATVYDTVMNALFSFTSPRGRVHDGKFFIDDRLEEYLILACDDSIGRVFHLGNSKSESTAELQPRCVAELTGHANRLKAVEIVRLQGSVYTTTISSDGFCHVYRLISEPWNESSHPIKIDPIVKYDTGGCRLTCLATVVASTNSSSQDACQEEAQSGPPSVSGTDDDDEEEEEEDDESADHSGQDLDANGEPIDLGSLSDASSES